MGLADDAREKVARERADAEASRQAALRPSNVPTYQHILDGPAAQVVREFSVEMQKLGVSPEPIYQFTYSRHVKPAGSWTGRPETTTHTFTFVEGNCSAG